MTSLYKDAERLVLLIKPFVSRAVPTIDSEEDISKLEYLLELHPGLIRDKLKVERELLNLEERYYNSILDNLAKIKDEKQREKHLRSTESAKAGDLAIAKYNINCLEKELTTTLGAFEVMLNLLKDDPNSFKVVYNNGNSVEEVQDPIELVRPREQGVLLE